MGYGNGNRFLNAYKAMPSSTSVKNNYNNQLLARRVNTLQRRVALNTGEVKSRQWVSAVGSVAVAGTATVVDLTNLAQGDEVFQREGNRIQITGVDIRYHVASRNLDGYLTLSPHGILPVAGDFDPVIDAHVKFESRQDIKELKFFKNYTSTNGTSMSHSRRFKVPIKVKYLSSGSNQVLANRLCFVIKNSTPSDFNYSYSIRLYYRDN